MYRYSEVQGIKSPLDPMRDMFVFLEYLTAKDYLINTLVSAHGHTKQDASSRADQIIPHIRTAIAFLEQSLSAPPELSFLPAYYGILNLMKTYILVGPHHRELASQRWHGATYPVEEKDSRNLLTEHIVLKSRGAIPLFYRTVTGKTLVPSQVTMGQIYPFVSGVTAEYSLATGQAARIASLSIEMQPHKHRNKKTLSLRLLRQPGDTRQYALRDFKALRLFKQNKQTRDLFMGRPFKDDVQFDDPRYREMFHPFLIYGYQDNTIFTPYCSKRMLLPEELPIALLFFHMSNVVRYKPEFLYRIRSSRFWPLLAAARQHSLLRMLVLVWSFIHQKELVLMHSY